MSLVERVKALRSAVRGLLVDLGVGDLRPFDEAE